MITRREAIKKTALLGTSLAVVSTIASSCSQQEKPLATDPFTLPPLPYAFDALEPHIDARTMEIHHSKHHATYVNNLNKVVADFPALAKKSVKQLLETLGSIPERIRPAIRNHGGGHYNHTLFWQMMKKNGGGKPNGELAKAIDKSFGSFERFQEKFTDTATRHFGSGWTWLTMGPRNDLRVESTPNQESPLSAGRIPLLGIDVWEHAYYLKYQNKRADYVTAFYNVTNWGFVAERFNKS
jgi:Fe-Mn family superoxide dismutase